MATINVEQVPQNVADYIRQFYTLSDNASATLDEYADQFSFTDGFAFRIGTAPAAHDRDGVKQWRKAAWDVVEKRTHSVFGVYTKAGQKTVDEHTPEVMLYGKVDYVKKDGSSASATWGGRIVFDAKTLQSGAQPKMRQYNVWVTPEP